MAEEPDHLDLSVTVGGASFTGTGPAERVMAALERFSTLVGNHGATPPPARTVSAVDDDATAEGAEESEAAAPPQRESPASQVPLPKFLERDTIKNNSQIATAIVVWAADHDGKTSVTNTDINNYWKGTRLRAPANLARDIQNAVRSGWLNREGKSFAATGYGREAIGLSS